MKTMEKWKHNAITEIMSYFDFNKVEKTMVALDWHWGMGDGRRVPSLTEIKEEALRLLTQSCKEDIGWSTGGFKVSINPKGKMLCLEFIVTDWDFYYSLD